MADAWEIAHGFSTNNAADALLDADGDTMTNSEEYLASSDPLDPASYLKIDSITASGEATLTFRTITNRTYTILYTDALGDDPWVKLADVPARATNGVASITDPNFTLSRFYCLRTPTR